MSEASFFDDAARTRVSEAVADVESRTAAEVVVVVQRASAPWREVDLGLGAATAFVVLLLVLFLPQPVPVIAMPVDVALGFVGGAVLAMAVAPLKRALLRRKRVDAQVLAMARAAFVAQGVCRTSGRTGILVYVSTLERRVEIVADDGVDLAKVGAPVDRLRASLAAGASLDAFLAALKELGAPLGEQLPRSADDVNELPDAPVMS